MLEVRQGRPLQDRLPATATVEVLGEVNRNPEDEADPNHAEAQA